MATMEAVSTSAINGWLAGWGVVAPVLTAAVSSWWSRRKQIQDRAFEADREKERREEALRDEKGRLLASRVASSFDRRRDLYIDFFSCSYDLVWNLATPEVPLTTEKERQLDVHRERFAQGYAKIVLLDNETVGIEAGELLNAAWSLRTAALTGESRVMDTANERLQAARAAFVLKAGPILKSHGAAVLQSVG